MSRHTSGPWEPVGTVMGFDGIGVFRKGQPRPFAVVAVVPKPPSDAGFGTSEEQAGNAHLISAAPDMLAALKQVYKDWDGEPEDMADVVDAIRKAEGKS